VQEALVGALVVNGCDNIINQGLLLGKPSKNPGSLFASTASLPA
jgi:hypothetical protein